MDDNNINLRLIEKVDKLESSYGRKFSNTQKILLSTDGSITAILDVLYGVLKNYHDKDGMITVLNRFFIDFEPIP